MTSRPEPTARQLLGYALPALPIAALSLPFYVMVPEFYTKDVGIPIATVGFVLLLVRILDAVTDPLAGALSDWTRPAFGRPAAEPVPPGSLSSGAHHRSAEVLQFACPVLARTGR